MAYLLILSAIHVCLIKTTTHAYANQVHREKEGQIPPKKEPSRKITHKGIANSYITGVEIDFALQ